MNELNAGNAVEFMERFGRSGDGVIKNIQYSIEARQAVIEFDLADAFNNYKWELVRFHFAGVSEFVYMNLHIMDGVVINYLNVWEIDGNVIFDFIPKKSHASPGDFDFSPDEHLDSYGMCAAKSVRWETL